MVQISPTVLMALLQERALSSELFLEFLRGYRATSFSPTISISCTFRIPVSWWCSLLRSLEPVSVFYGTMLIPHRYSWGIQAASRSGALLQYSRSQFAKNF